MPRDGLIGDEGERKIAAAVASGRIAPSRAAYWRQQAREGVNLDVLETIAPVTTGPGVVASGTLQGDGDAIYDSLYPTVEASRRAADRQLLVLEAASADPASDQEIYEGIFGKGARDR